MEPHRPPPTWSPRELHPPRRHDSGEVYAADRAPGVEAKVLDSTLRSGTSRESGDRVPALSREYGSERKPARKLLQMHPPFVGLGGDRLSGLREELPSSQQLQPSATSRGHFGEDRQRAGGQGCHTGSEDRATERWLRWKARLRWERLDPREQLQHWCLVLDPRAATTADFRFSVPGLRGTELQNVAYPVVRARTLFSGLKAPAESLSCPMPTVPACHGEHHAQLTDYTDLTRAYCIPFHIHLGEISGQECHRSAELTSEVHAP